MNTKKQLHFLAARFLGYPSAAALWMILALTAPCDAGQRGLPPTSDIPNFGKVDETLYRGAQPDELGMKYLKSLGVKTVINLRMTNDVWKAEADEARANGITYTNVPLNSLSAPTVQQVNQVLALIESSPGPVFIHCQFGCDRTGTMVACYRIQHHKWSGEFALREAEAYGMSRFEFEMKAFIRRFAKTAGQ
jgi:tyrosine-protein phosphatase SIW14